MTAPQRATGSRRLERHCDEDPRRLDEPGGREAESEADRNDYCHLLEAVLNLKGDIHWAEDLIWGIVSEEYELECPDPDGCAAVWMLIGERGLFITSEDYALYDDAESLPLHPAALRALDGPGRRLQELALSDGTRVTQATQASMRNAQPSLRQINRSLSVCHRTSGNALPRFPRGPAVAMIQP
jgi:hypothetical protein